MLSRMRGACHGLARAQRLCRFQRGSASARFQSLRCNSTSSVGDFRRSASIDGVTLVTNKDSARIALAELERLKGRPHSWDTETTGVLLGSGSQRQSPVNHGNVVCATCYCGDDADFGSGPRLFVDNSGPAEGLLEYFKEYFEDEGFQKVFHNYSFERHILRRHGIRLQGLHADTLHLARLFDTSLASWEGAVQEQLRGHLGQHPSALSSGVLPASAPPPPPAQTAPTADAAPRAVLGVTLGRRPLEKRFWEGASGLHTCAEVEGKPRRPPTAALPKGYSLKRLATHFGLAEDLPARPNGFAGLFGSHATAAKEAMDSPERFEGFVTYATQDAVLTHKVFQHLRENLTGLPWHSQVHQRPVHELMRDKMVQKELQSIGRPKTFESLQYSTGRHMWNLFELYLRDFAECLADLEEVGVDVDRNALLEMEANASRDLADHTQEFASCMASLRNTQGELINPQAALINIRSRVQLRTLLFGGVENRRNKDVRLQSTKQFRTPKEERAESAERTFELNSLELTPGPKRNHYSESGWPKTAAAIVEQLTGDSAGKGAPDAVAPRSVGEAERQLLEKGYSAEDAERASRGLRQLSAATKTKAVLSGFIQPLLQHSSMSGRIHPSWQFDTSTGRLACRAPNLQNLPRAEHDRYGVRKALCASPGKLFVIADYSQLELRVLAHVANCPFMIQKIGKGGDYHSEVAAQIFPHVQKAVQAKQAKISDDGSGDAIQTIKQVFNEERSQAKAVTFGIIYGMTAPSLAEDLGVSLKSAEALIEAWLRYKPAVRTWMDNVKRDSRANLRTLSMLGRARTLPFIRQDTMPQYRFRSERAAVNFGIQGSAADIVVAAMLRLWRDPRLERLGFRVVLQIHDEFVLEGPEGSAEEASEIVREIMMDPFKERSPDFKFRVPLEVAMEVKSSLG